MEYWFAEEKVEQRCIVGLDDKEEDLFRRNLEEGRTNDGVGRICPYPGVDEVRVPWSSGYDSNLRMVSACRFSQFR